MNANLTSEQKRRLQELGQIAYERDLSTELTRLEREFRRWRAGEINVFEVSEAIHRFHQGPGRELFVTYAMAQAEIAVAGAINRGTISREEAGPNVVQVLDPLLTDRASASG
jgi:hypothetical protein